MKFTVKSLCGLPDDWGVLSKHNRTEITKSSSEVFQGFLWSPSTEESNVSVSNSTFGSCLLSLGPHFFSFLIFPSFFLSNNNVKDTAELFLTVRLFMCSLSLWFCLNAPTLLLLSISMWICWFFRVHLCNNLANLYLQFEIIFITDFQKCNLVVKVTVKPPARGLTLLAVNG